MRMRTIDSFRGLGIVLMVFFTLTLRLSNQLPDFIRHNVPESLHIGDFVLPMFLFASGMSLVFFAKKREKKKRSEYILDIIERFGKLLLVSFFLTPFSAGGFLLMDEVMLSAVLFLITIILIGFPEAIIATIGVIIFLFYIFLQQTSMLPDFTEYYLGGYAAALFYLPVMLGGVIAGKKINEIEKLIPVALILSVILLLIVPPYKMNATPSFMALSVLFSLVVFALIRNVKIEQLDYLGRKPFLYWVLMFVILLIPLEFYLLYAGLELPLPFDWITAIILSLLCSVVLYLVSRGIDFIIPKSSIINR